MISGAGTRSCAGWAAGCSILPGNLSSLDRAYGDPYSVVVYNVTNVSPVGSLSAVVLNRAAPLEGGTPLLRTSFLSWTDTNGNERIDSEEALGAFSVMAREKIGNGELYCPVRPEHLHQLDAGH